MTVLSLADQAVLAEAAQFISFDLDGSFPSPTADRLLGELAEAKARRVYIGDELGAKHVWCLEQAINVRMAYVRAFHQLKAGEHYEGWCSLEQAEITLSFLERHVPIAGTLTLPGLISKLVAQYQKLFPYAVFFSPEFIVDEAECTICGKPKRLCAGCGHRVGEIYSGEMAARRITKAQFVGVGAVHTPLQKYSVGFAVDDDGNRKDHYDYSVVEYLVGALASPFDDWDVEKTTRLHPRSLFDHLGPSEPCPCESGETYEACCLPKEGVERPHVEFSFAVPPPAGYAEVAYTKGFFHAA